MFFILSKTVYYLVMPLTLVVVSFLLAVFLRKQRLKKLFFWLGFGMLVFFSNDFISNEVMHLWELEATPYADLRPRKLGIVLTGTTIDKPYPDDRVYFNKGADRVIHTVHLYKQGLIDRILISGGSGTLSGEAEPEANKYLRVMILMGVDSADILMENETRNTYESAVAVRPMLDSLGYSDEDCLLITSAFHMRRSLACYRKAGVNLTPFSADFYSRPRDFYPDSILVPKVESIVIWHKLFKEWIGFAAYKFAGYL